MICLTIIGYFLLTDAGPVLTLAMPNHEECAALLIKGGPDAKCEEIEVCFVDE